MTSSRGSGFLRAVAVLSSGQAIAVGLPILAAPILGRLYLPADFGILALYMAMSSFAGAGVLASLQYHRAIIAERNDSRARQMAQVAVLSGAAVGMVVAIFALASFWTWLTRPAFAESRVWIFALPVLSVAASFMLAVETLANRLRRYRSLAVVPVAVTVTMLTVSILTGLAGWGEHGLLAGYFSGHVAQLLAYGQIHRTLGPMGPRISAAQLVALARRHRRFPIYMMPSAVLANIGQTLPVIALTAVSQTALLGLFNRAQQIVALPVTLLAPAVSKVFQQQGAEQFRVTGSCRPLVLRTAFVLAAIGAGPSAFFLVFAPGFFAFYLGEAWRPAGDLARYLVPMLWLRLIVLPLQPLFAFTGHQRIEFLLALLSLAMSLLALSIGVVLSPVWIVINLVIASCAGMVLQFAVALHVAGGVAPSRSSGA